MQQRVSQVCGVLSLLCLFGAAGLDASALKYSWDKLISVLVWAAILLPIVAAVTGSKRWLLVWVLLAAWGVYVLANTPMVRM